MFLKITRLKFFARPTSLAALACACLASPAAAQIEPQPLPERRPPILRPPSTTRREVPHDPTPGPTIKKSDELELPASRPPRSYDEGRDATYLNIAVTLLAPKTVRGPKAAPRLEGRAVSLTFQLIYRGRRTHDLISSYLIVESTAAPTEADKLSAVRRLEIDADPYEYVYERQGYQAEQVSPVGAAAQRLRREVAAFKLPTEDLPQLANAGRLVVRLGAETFTVRSQQLSELRRTLAAGADK